MCNCVSCTETDSYAEKGFASWPKGEHIRRHGKDKAYAAHWAHCGAEAHQQRTKLNMKMHIPAVTRGSEAGPASPAPASMRFKHTGLNRDGWRERMEALNLSARP